MVTVSSQRVKNLNKVAKFIKESRMAAVKDGSNTPKKPRITIASLQEKIRALDIQATQSEREIARLEGVLEEARFNATDDSGRYGRALKDLINSGYEITYLKDKLAESLQPTSGFNKLLIRLFK